MSDSTRAVPPSPDRPAASRTLRAAPVRAAGHPADDPAARGARWALLALFALFGATATSWLSRLPSLRESLDIDEAQLGAILVVGAVGALASVVSTGTVVTRFGNRATLLAATVGSAVAYVLLAAGAATASVPLFIAGVFLNGVCGAMTNTPLNLAAALVEQRLGRSLLPRFHAFFSVGAAAGAAAAAGFSAAQVHPAVQLVVLAAVISTLRGILTGAATAITPARSAHEPGHEPVGHGDGPEAGAAHELDRHPGRQATRTSSGTVRRGASLRTALGAWREPRTLLIGLVLLGASLSEGAAGNWLSLAVVDGFALPESAGAAAFGTFVVSMTVVRLLGTRLLDRFGRVAMLRACGASGLAGLLLFGLAPSVATAWAGIVLWGVGAALASPVGIAAASDEPTRAAARVSVATSFSSISQLCAPPLLGLLAATVGARHALLAITVAIVLSLVVAGAVRPLGAGSTSERTSARVAEASEAGVAARVATEDTATEDVVRADAAGEHPATAETADAGLSPEPSGSPEPALVRA
ncbi:MFS transporter [Antribacter sp. KLBMP9083]|uniref:MFS transporter n=1 Tax=Antribacter soli TaxID=2910976 RepID=A0AA41QBP5_9MICO|nr:MFS transporter [Antribacter soli]MCF4120498.1 MFS transporter [Antribacter soli]